MASRYAVTRYSQPQMAGFRPAGPPSWEQVPKPVEIPEGVSAKDALARAGVIQRRQDASEGYYSASQGPVAPSMLEAPPTANQPYQVQSQQRNVGSQRRNVGSQSGPVHVTAERLEEYAQKLGLDNWVRSALQKTGNRRFIRKDLAAQLMSKAQVREIPQNLVGKLLSRFDRLFPATPGQSTQRPTTRAASARRLTEYESSRARSHSRRETTARGGTASYRGRVAGSAFYKSPQPQCRRGVRPQVRPVQVRPSATKVRQSQSLVGRRASLPDNLTLRRSKPKPYMGRESKHDVSRAPPSSSSTGRSSHRHRAVPYPSIQRSARSPVRGPPSRMIDPGGNFRETIRRSVSRGRSAGYREFGRERSASRGATPTDKKSALANQKKRNESRPAPKRRKSLTDLRSRISPVREHPEEDPTTAPQRLTPGAAPQRVTPTGPASRERKLGIAETIMNRAKAEVDAAHRRLGKRKMSFSSTLKSSFDKPREIAMQQQARQSRQRSSSFSSRRIARVEQTESPQRPRANSFSHIEPKKCHIDPKTKKVVDELESVKSGLEADIDRIAKRLAKETETLHYTGAKPRASSVISSRSRVSTTVPSLRSKTPAGRVQSASKSIPMPPMPNLALPRTPMKVRDGGERMVSLVSRVEPKVLPKPEQTVAQELQAMKDRIALLEQDNQKLHKQLRIRSVSVPAKRTMGLRRSYRGGATSFTTPLKGGQYSKRIGSTALAPPTWRPRKRARYARDTEWSYYR